MFGDTGNCIGRMFEAPVVNSNIFSGLTPSSKLKYKQLTLYVATPSASKL